MIRHAAAALAVLALSVSARPAAADLAPCLLAGPAGTVSVVRIELPHGAPSLAMRITTPSVVTSASPGLAGGRSSWHLATEVALVRVRDGALVASRLLQSGSSPRRFAVTGAGTQTRGDLVGPGAPFNHNGGAVPDYVPAGRYYLVAFGSDGSPATPNPGWSAEAAFGAPVSCTPMSVQANLFDDDQTAFTGGTQVSAYGPGMGKGTALKISSPHRFAIGLVDAQTQVAGNVSVRMAAPHQRPLAVTDAITSFAGPRGGYSFNADWTGAFPLVLVCGVMFDAP